MDKITDPCLISISFVQVSKEYDSLFGNSATVESQFR